METAAKHTSAHVTSAMQVFSSSFFFYVSLYCFRIAINNIITILSMAVTDKTINGNKCSGK